MSTFSLISLTVSNEADFASNLVDVVNIDPTPK